MEKLLDVACKISKKLRRKEAMISDLFGRPGSIDLTA